ncbi:MAG: hypothetical protein K0R50_2086 [Eubacterium sp.]|nr:hypothetical protein [Eubacterium sp.]
MTAVRDALLLVLLIFEWVLIARVLITWLPVSRDNKAIDLLYTITEPVLAPIRNMLSRSRFMNNSMFSMMDFSPIVAFILISVLRRVIFVVFNMFYY